AVFCILLLLTCTGVSFGQQLLLPERMDIKVGENLVITPISIPDSSRVSTKWNYNGKTFLTEIHSGIIIQPPYTDRASLNTNTLALTLKSLTESDSGQYTLEVVTVTETNSSVTSVQVFVPASNVTILPSQTELVEFNSTVSLRCSASGSFLTFVWLNRSSEVTEDDRVQLTDSNSSLTITNVTRADRGPYYCNVSNSVSQATSPSMNLIIHYGPENVAVKADPEGPVYRAGSNVKLTCSAESSPAAEFHWAVNGSALGQMGHKLIMNNIQSSQSGSYTCIAHNTKTLRYFTSEPISITVLVPASNVTILPSQTELVEFNSTVSLRCSASGSFLTFVWLNRSSEVTAGDRVQLTDSNSSLTITNVIRGDTGPYQCTVSNSVSQATSPSMNLTIHYGPEKVSVKADPVGPIYRAGSNVILTCSAESSPAAEFQWAVNGAALSQMGHELTMNNIQSSQSGSYTCIAHNTKT
ncbi:carcinoembryonic antigen-related cell adhesion molecule 5 isoform X1, partial [Silurus meridionalis]